MITQKTRSRLKKTLKRKVSFNVSFAPHTTFKIGGKAQVWARPTAISEVQWLIRFCRSERIPFVVVGRGSNILVKDEGIEGIVITLVGTYFRRISTRASEISAGAAVDLGRFLKSACAHSLSGCEFLSGIPGTVGGALVMNAGLRRRSRKREDISQIVREVEIIDRRGERCLLKRDRINFGYRTSSLADSVILRSRFILKKIRKSEVERRIKDYHQRRRSLLDLDYPSAGCVFKNPAHSSVSSAVLIENCGLKGKRLGNAMISLRHANFIVNVGRARASDVLKLMDMVQKEVRRISGVKLTPEIKVIG